MTELFAWSETLNVGIQEVDEQHRALSDHLNALAEAVGANSEMAALRPILDDLADDARTHFALEESLMRVSNYPEFQAHKQLHEALMGQMLALQERLDRGEGTINFELLHYLKVWLSNHIDEADRRFGAYFLSIGGSSGWAPQVASSMATTRRRWKFW